MGRRLVNLTRDNLSDLPDPCLACAFWETSPAARNAPSESGPSPEKESWLSNTLLEWGSCGQLLYVDDVPAGYVLYAPPAYVPRSTSFATAPVAADAVQLVATRVVPAFQGGGLGRVLIQAASADITRRGVRALEAFGRPANRPTATDEAESCQPDRPGRLTGVPAASCLMPADFLLSVGFTTVRPHPFAARLRLDVKNAITWREDVEAVLERLFGTATRPVLSR